MLRGTRQGRETLGFLDRSIQVRLLLSLRGVEPETNQRPSLPIVQVSATRPKRHLSCILMLDAAFLLQVNELHGVFQTCNEVQTFS